MRWLPGCAQPAAILFLTDLEDAPKVPEKALVELYGLTAAEARLSGLCLRARI